MSLQRGRSATNPTEIPAAGWKDILWRTYKEISQDRVLLIAGGITFYLLLATVPTITAIVSIYGLFADRADMLGHAALFAGVIPGDGMDLINDQLKRLAAQDNVDLGLASAISLGIAIWSANSGVKALFDGMNVAYDETEKRGFVALTLASLSLTAVLIAFALLLIGLIILLPAILAFVRLPPDTEWLIRILGYSAVFVALCVGIAALNRWGPSRNNAKWKWVTLGSVLSAALIALASAGFSFYVSYFDNYNATYGSLGAIICFMTWIWISNIILLLGAELNAEIEHQTIKDTTVGVAQPMGTRGAEMADTVGAAVNGTVPDVNSTALQDHEFSGNRVSNPETKEAMSTMEANNGENVRASKGLHPGLLPALAFAAGWIVIGASRDKT